MSLGNNISYKKWKLKVIALFTLWITHVFDSRIVIISTLDYLDIVASVVYLHKIAMLLVRCTTVLSTLRIY